MKFKLHSNYQPRGDQPAAIDQLYRGLEAGEKQQVVLGGTGSGKTFTMAKLIEHADRPALVLAHNKTLAAQLYHEFKGFFPENVFLSSRRRHTSLQGDWSSDVCSSD